MQQNDARFTKFVHHQARVSGNLLFLFKNSFAIDASGVDESEAGEGIPVYRESEFRRNKKWRELHNADPPPSTSVLLQQGVMALPFVGEPSVPLTETNSLFDKVCPTS